MNRLTISKEMVIAILTDKICEIFNIKKEDITSVELNYSGTFEIEFGKDTDRGGMVESKKSFEES